MSGYKPYKLIPEKHYQDLINEKKCTNLAPHENQVNHENNERSIKSIQDNNEMEFNSLSKENGVNISNLYGAPSPHLKTGRGLKDPLWVYDNDNTLPQFSNPKKLLDSFSNYNKILDLDLPEKLKVKIAQFYRDKYDNKRNKSIDRNDEDDDDDDDDENYDDNDVIIAPKAALDVALKRIGQKSKVKMDLANKIASVLLKSSKYIKWDGSGQIIFPKYINEINLFNLLSIIVYARKGSENDIQNIFNIIRPFFRKIEDYIQNRSLLDKIRGFRNKKNKGKSLYQSIG